MSNEIRLEHLDPLVVEILRGKTTQERIALALAANRLVRERLRSFLRHENPDWTDDQIAAEVASRILWNKATS